MHTKILFVAAAALLATTAGAQTTTTTVKQTTTEPAAVSETTKHTTTVTDVAPDGVYLKNGVWMKGSRRATSAEISAHKSWVKTQTTKTTVKTVTPQ